MFSRNQAEDSIKEGETYARTKPNKQTVSLISDRKIMTIAHTNREQLGGHTLELAQTLGDSVGCR